MALNSYVTANGLEMGRAQVVQAEACRKSPSVYMNPILLKPTTDVGSQVVVNGKPMGNMLAKDYFKYKKRLIPDILNAYERLAKVSNIVVIEGAGSPAEINLKADDIVNMGLAKMLNAPVVLVGDIDRGGVFAQLYGTVALLERCERELIKGLIINKFRGDKTILQSGLTQIERLCDKPVLGVVPYTHVDIDDEDSLSERLTHTDTVGLVDIVVVRFPHISNFTDFAPLESVKGISVRYVTKTRDFKSPDLVILAGTKNTLADTLWLRESGLETLVKQYVSKGGLLFGICGGYQMLGSTISDPHGIEHGGTVSGMGLLNLETTLETSKTTTQTTTTTNTILGEYSRLSNLKVTGYEIHCGNTTHRTHSAFSDGTLGVYDGNVFGTYLHGIFENDQFRNALLETLFEKKHISWDALNSVDFQTYRDSQYDLLADVIRHNLNMEEIYRIVKA
jgi:adenosylcobyric acid synthase